MTTTVAAFDVDGTLTTRDCVVPFMRHIAGTRRVAARLARRPDRLIPSLVRRDRDAVKALAAAAAFTGQRIDDLESAGSDFAQHVFSSWMRNDTTEVLAGHLGKDHRVVLVSASFEIYLRPLADLLGVDSVLGTRLAHVDGVATGDLDGPNCRGSEKVRRLHTWLDAGLGGRDAAHVVAYGDSAGDRELLADADDAHWVNRDRAPR
ncbi:MAG: HAD-IB family hydrolase [Ilumatobacter sp.]